MTLTVVITDYQYLLLLLLLLFIIIVMHNTKHIHTFGVNSNKT
jgi:uncharacterized integral membrane protein